VSGVTVTATESIPRDQVDAVERRVAELVRSAGKWVSGAQLTLRRDTDPAAERPFVADVIAFHGDGLIAAHATGATPREAGDAVAEQLRRRLGRIAC
jgi:ribosome-associated translation inhibitor RaiA